LNITTIKRDKHSFYSKIWDKKRDFIYLFHNHIFV